MRKSRWGIIMLLICVLGTLVAFSSCSKDDDDVSGGGNGTSQTGNSYGTLGENDITATGDAKDITYLGATMLGSINSNVLLGKDFKVYFLVSFEYKTESDLIFDNTYVGDSTRLEIKDIIGSKFEHRCTSLYDNKEYFYRTCVKVGNQYYYGSVKKFSTKDLAKAVNIKITSIDEVTPYSAKIHFEDKSDPLAIKEIRGIGYIGFRISEDPELVSDSDYGVGFPESGNYVEISNLESNKAYYCRSYYRLKKSYEFVSKNTFTTAPDDGKREVGKAVDLGLSVKWADRNVGAFSEECKGWYFAFGETEKKENFTEDNYKWIEYRYIRDFFKENKIADKNGVLYPEYDVASVKWGNGWRMPTKEEAQELFEKCKFEEYSEVKGVYGYRITGPNGNSIFIPNTWRYDDEKLGMGSEYWCSYCDNYPYAIDFQSTVVWSKLSYYGLQVRPVHK